MSQLKTICLLVALLITPNLFPQDADKELLTFNLYEIQIFRGNTLNGTHIVKMDRNGMVLKKDKWKSMKDSQSEVVNFYKVVSQLKGRELKRFRKDYNSLLLFINDFDFKNYTPLKGIRDTIIAGEKIQVREEIESIHNLGTSILFIDEDMQSYYIRYYFCEEKLDEFIDKINQLIPDNLKEEYKMKKRCFNK